MALMPQKNSIGTIKPLLIVIICVSGLLPIILYWYFLAGVPGMTVSQARQELNMNNSPALLIDVRDQSTYAAGHLSGARNWPLDEIRALKNPSQIPAQFRNHTLLLICSSGITSALAVRRLEKLTTEKAYSIRGGMQEWIGERGGQCPLRFCRLSDSTGREQAFPERNMSVFEQWAASVAAFGIKPLYMIISLVLVLVLWRQPSADLAGLRWALIFFFFGEGFCAINYLFFRENASLVEYLHMFGMTLAFGFTTYALIEGFELRIIKYSDLNKKCAALDICGDCYKYKAVPCKARTIYLLFILILIVLACIPLLSYTHGDYYSADILGTRYNYSHPVLFQLFEIRYAPIMAIFFFTLATLAAWRNREAPSVYLKVFLASGTGFLGFSLMRLIFFAVYRDNLWWYIIGEEITELLFVAGVGVVLWTFRHRLLIKKPLGVGRQ